MRQLNECKFSPRRPAKPALYIQTATLSGGGAHVYGESDGCDVSLDKLFNFYEIKGIFGVKKQKSRANWGERRAGRGRVWGRLESERSAAAAGFVWS